MYCKMCGNKVEGDRTICPGCAQNQTGMVKVEKKEPNKKKSKKWIGIVGVIVIIIVFFIATGGSGSDERNKVAEEFVQESYYDFLEKVTIKEILEYNWKDGRWDSFLADYEDEEVQIVEYAKDEERNTLIQFTVNDDNTEYNLVHFKVDGEAYELNEATTELDSMYFDYIKEEYPVQDIDIAEYINDIEGLLSASKSFAFIDEEDTICQDITGKTDVLLKDNKVYSIEIEGDENSSPMFANITIGDDINSIDATQIENMGYSYIPLTEDGMILYGNMETLEGVEFGYNEQGVIDYILWMRDLVEIQSDFILVEEDKVIEIEIEESVAERPEELEEIKNVDYGLIYGGILDSAAAGEFGEDYNHALYDMNKDGYLELFVETGTCSADMAYEVYSTYGERTIYLGAIPGLVSIYESSDGAGVYTYYERRESATIRLYTMENEVLYETTIFDGSYENMPEMNMLGNRIEMKTISEFGVN